MDYKVGLVADLIGGNKKAAAKGKFAALFSGPRQPSQQSDTSDVIKSNSPATKTKNVSQKSGKVKSAKEKSVKIKKSKVKNSDAGTPAVVSSPSSLTTAEGFSPPPGILHESLATSSPEQRKGQKRTKAPDEVDEESDVEQKEKTKRPRRDRLKKASEKRTIFVGNVPLSCSKKQLLKLFRESGEVENVRFRCAPVADPSLPKRVAVITQEYHDQRHNISAYVCFKEKEAAKKALGLNGHVIDGLHIRVDLAAKKDHDTNRSIFVGNIPFAIEEESIRSHFEDCGDVENVRVIRDRKTNLGKGFCYILFESKDSVSLALKLNKSTLAGRELRVQRCSEQSSAQQKKKEKANSAAKGEKSSSSKEGKGESKMKFSSQSASAEKSTTSGDGKLKLKMKHAPKFWQPTNATTAAMGIHMSKNKKQKKGKQKKRRKVDEVSRVLGPISQPPEKGKKNLKTAKKSMKMKKKTGVKGTKSKPKGRKERG